MLVVSGLVRHGLEHVAFSTGLLAAGLELYDGRVVLGAEGPAGACAMKSAAVLAPEPCETEIPPRGIPNIHFRDMADMLYAGNIRNAVQSGIVIYRDNSDLTGTFADTLAPLLETAMSGLVSAGAPR